MQLPCPKCSKLLEAPQPLPNFAQCPFCGEVFDPQPVSAAAPPPGASQPVTFVTTYSAHNLVHGPAVALMVVGILNVLFALIDLIYGVQLWFDLKQGQAPPPLPGPLQNLVQVTPATVTAGIVMDVVRLALAALIIFGSLRMRNLESYGLAVAASVASMIPCVTCCFCLGIPLGIWSLIVLSRPEVRSSFR